MVETEKSDNSSRLLMTGFKMPELSDLLGRAEIRLNSDRAKSLLRGKTVLVTGGAGSIGSELCRQIAAFGTSRVVAFDFNENGLYELDCELSEVFSNFHTALGSVRDMRRLREVYAEFRPDIVFHAAAHKHVPMMEANLFEAFINNVLGTYNAALAAEEFKAEKFILISTDKAVNPSSVMGASKRVAELLVQNLNSWSGTVFTAVRFGNVLGSNGSVIPRFIRQIEKGGPLTVTDRSIRRYIMTVSEAVQLVLEASAMAKGSEIFMLDMGEPVYIYDLACRLIRLAGLVPERDIKLEITGLRAGEKLCEETSFRAEGAEKTDNDSVFILKPCGCRGEEFDALLTRLIKAVFERDAEELRTVVQRLVPNFC